MTALEELRDKVAAGTAIVENFCTPYTSRRHHEHEALAYRAYNGSLDAALALHNAVISEDWGYWIHKNGQITLLDAVMSRSGAIVVKSENACPARAWLLAILDALIAQEADQ